MLRAIWGCSECYNTKETKYMDEEFKDPKYLGEFIKYSKHTCLKCNTQCSMTITKIEKI